MKLLEGLSGFLLVCAIFAQDISEREQKIQEEGTSLRGYNQDWRSVDYLSPLHETSGWIPHPQSETEEQPLKRRRIRKRKRRPPVYIIPEEETDEVVASRRKRPQRLDQIKEPWEEMTEEITQKSYNRRRLTPIYNEDEKVNESKVQSYEKIRDPFTALQEAEEKQKTKVEESSTKISDLKTLLKQSGGLSLSEVLQQKNLTLSELLNGNRQAISALAREAETTEVVTSTESIKYRRLPPSVATKKDVNRNLMKNIELNERLSTEEVMEAQRKRLALLHGHKDTKMFPDVIKFDVVTEQTTEKRIFVPSIETKVSTEYVDITTTPATTTTTTPATPVSPKSRIRNLPMTSAKLNKLAHHLETSTIPNKAVSINVNEIFGLNIFNKNETELSDEPLKMIIDLGEVTTEIFQEIRSSTSENLENLTPTTTMSLGEKLKHVTAKEEIMEILSDPSEREQLSEILRKRNMTVEELVAQRERGSSQLHLADIFHNKTKEPEPNDEPLVGHIQPDVEIPILNRKGKTIPVAPVVSSTPSFLTATQETTTKLAYIITSFPTYKIETNKDAKAKPFLPIWQQLYPNFFTDVYENNNYEETQGIVRPTTAPTRFEELDSLEEIENSLAEAANGELKVDLPQDVYDDDEEDFISVPSGVKSAILASLAIIGLSLLVFLTILIIFKWSQRQKRRLNYNGSFLGSKIMSPILAPDQKRTFRTFVSETLGKKKNYYKAHVQSMSDSFWDKDEKKSYMI